MPFCTVDGETNANSHFLDRDSEQNAGQNGPWLTLKLEEVEAVTMVNGQSKFTVSPLTRVMI